MWPSAKKLRAEWSKVRRVEFPWSLDVTKCVGTQAIMDLGATFDRAQKEQREAKAQGRKPRKQFGFPKFKAKNKTTPGSALWNDQFSVCVHHSVFGKSHSTVRIPNLGWVRLWEVVPNMGGILGARVSHRRGRWFVAFQYDMDWNDGEQSDKAAEVAQRNARKAAIASGINEEEATRAIVMKAGRSECLLPLHPAPGTVGGGDLGLIDALVGRVEQVGGKAGITPVTFNIPNPKRLTRTEKQRRLRRRRERKLSRSVHRARVHEATGRKLAKKDTSPVTGEDLKTVKLRLSRRQQRQSNRLSRQSWAVADLREDFLHKASHRVSRVAEIMVLENLHVRGMMTNHCLARSLSDAALRRLGTFIEYKVQREGGLVLWAPRFFPSSKRCSACGKVAASLELSERSWKCEECGTAHDRDANAATNLCWLGQLAAAEGSVPEAAKLWEVWIYEARRRVAEWRAAKAAPRDFPVNDILGTASPEVTRGEMVDRARRNPGRKPPMNREPHRPGSNRAKAGGITFAHQVDSSFPTKPPAPSRRQVTHLA